MHTADLLPVSGLTAESNGQAGQAMLKFICPSEQRSQITTFAVEWSDDGGATRHNSTYKNAEKILVKDLPNRKDVRFWVCCLGTRGRKSQWSGMAEAFVL